LQQAAPLPWPARRTCVRLAATLPRRGELGVHSRCCTHAMALRALMLCRKRTWPRSRAAVRQRRHAIIKGRQRQRSLQAPH
jgi:hypothetical protein